MTSEAGTPPTASKSNKRGREARPTPAEPLKERWRRERIQRLALLGSLPLLALVGFLVGRIGQESASSSVVTADALAGLRQEVRELRQRPPGPAGAADLKSLRDELEKLRHDISESSRLLQTLAGQPKPPSGLPDLQGLRQDMKHMQEGLARLGKTTEALSRELERLKPPPVPQAIVEKMSPESADVLVLAMHSENLGINHYQPAFRELFADPGRLALYPAYRLGLALVDGGKGPDLVFPFTDRERKQVFRVYPAPTGSTDRLDTLGVRVRELFKETDRARHCLIVASVRCVPVPPARYKEWDGLRVSVLLIGPEKYVNDLSGEQWKQWLDFCGQGQGRLAVLTERAGNPPDEQVLQRLRDYLRDWTQPQYPVRKG